MQPRRTLHPVPPRSAGLPAHPGHNFQQQWDPTAQASQVVHALNSTLSNPYARPAYSSHYAQAYMQASSSAPLVTSDGYTLSSTYSPQLDEASSSSSRPRSAAIRGRPGSATSTASKQSANSNGHWYDPGSCRCSYQSCTFTGSKNSVEIHMMDRHLIYPPGWDKKKQKQDWDADPSLKGKPVPIPGTGIVLDTPETIDAWIAERKKRFPTATKVKEKEANLRDAIARGQISADDPSLRGAKRRKLDPDGDQNNGHNGKGGRGSSTRGRGRGAAGKRGTDGGWRGRGRGLGNLSRPTHSDIQILKNDLPQVSSAKANVDSDSDSDASSSSDMDPERDAISSKAPSSTFTESVMASKDVARSDDEKLHDEGAGNVPAMTSSSMGPPVHHPHSGRRPTPQPKKPPYNAFTNRPSLLRNLLFPEIRMTVSNLSQAIRFLVDNDFLEGVELKPGEANEKAIEVIAESEAAGST